MSRPAVFFDRDGVLNVDHGYVSDPSQLEFIDGAPEAVEYLNRLGFLVVVITNQSGIARGMYSEADYRAFMAHMEAELALRGAHFDGVYFCPHLPDATVPELALDCECRKPKPGMLLAAIRDLDIDPARSVMIGDKVSDIEAATAAGVRGERYQGGNLLEFVQRVV